MNDSKTYTAAEYAALGKYYSFVDAVWSPSGPVSFEGGFNAIKREKPHGHFDVLLATFGLAKEKKSSKASSRRSKLTATVITETKKDLFGEDYGEDAHLIPDSSDCAPSYGIIGQAIMGVNIESLALEKLRVVARKAREVPVEAIPEMKGQSGQEKQLVTLILKYLANGPRLSMKHLYINRFRVSGPHRESYDVDPQVVILPLMTLDAAKAWTPDHEYSVAIVCSTAGAYKNQVGAKPIFNEYEREVGEADRDEMKHATDLLAAMVKAHAEIASGTRDGAVVSPIDLISKEEEKQKITALATSLGSGSVQIPVLTTTTGSKVLKVKLQNKYDYKIPDPMLLAMRAAINWYYLRWTQKKH
jgi:hypothetical protein